MPKLSSREMSTMVLAVAVLILSLVSIVMYFYTNGNILFYVILFSTMVVGALMIYSITKYERPEQKSKGPKSKRS